MKSILPGLLLVLATSVAAAGIQLDYVVASTTPLENPHDLKLSPDGKYLLVADVGNNRVVLLDPETLDLVSSFGGDHQSGTHDVDFDQAGRVYVADTHNNRVTIYQLEGRKARLSGELSEAIRGPEGVLAHPNGRIYVAGAWSGNVVAYQDGRLVGELQGLSSPHDLEIADNGDLYLAEAGRSRILILSPQLDIKAELSAEKYDFNGVRYLDFTDDGVLIAADKNNHQVKFIDADGKMIYRLGSGKPGRDRFALRTPEGVEILNDSLWIADSGNDRVIRYRLRRD